MQNKELGETDGGDGANFTWLYNISEVCSEKQMVAFFPREGATLLLWGYIKSWRTEMMTS